MTTGSIFTVLGIVAALLIVAIVAGCKSTPANQGAAILQPQITAASASVLTARTLLTVGDMTVPTAHAVSQAAHAAYDGFDAALTSIDAGQPIAAQVQTQILTSLATLSDQLVATSKTIHRPLPPVSPALAEKLATIRRTTADGRKSLTPVDIAALIQLAIQLTPQVEQLIGDITGGNVTPATARAALITFRGNLSALDAAIAAKGG